MVTATKSKKSMKKKAPAKMKQGQKMGCPECGLVMVVDEACGCTDLSGLECCGTPMKKKR